MERKHYISNDRNTQNKFENTFFLINHNQYGKIKVISFDCQI